METENKTEHPCTENRGGEGQGAREGLNELGLFGLLYGPINLLSKPQL
jgi:hypothetical protein